MKKETKDTLKKIREIGKEIYTHKAQRLFGSIEHKNGRKKKALRKDIARMYTNMNKE